MLKRIYRDHAEGVWLLAVVAVLGIVVGLLMWEAHNRPIAGDVVDKQHIESFTHMHTSQTCGSYDSNGTCLQYYTTVTSHYHPDEYYVVIEGLNHKGEFKRGRWSVSEQRFNALEIGQYWSSSEP